MNLDDIRKEIDVIDKEILSLFIKRMECAEKIALIKEKENLPIVNEAREEEILKNMAANAHDFKEETRELFSKIMDISKKVQIRKLETTKK